MKGRRGSGGESVGQLLIIGFDGTEISQRLTSLLRELQPAGVILFARNIKSPEQTWRLLRECRKCVAVPLFTCVDLEGGTVDRFRGVLGATPSAADVFATGDRKLHRKHGRFIGENCRALGFNLNFAPVLDLSFDASRAVMASRTVSKNARDATVYAREFLAGLHAANVLGCGKHFPGLGEGTLDSHEALPVIAKPLKRMWPEDLLPYRMLRKALPFIMIAHAAYPEITGDSAPASLSESWIRDILRKRIGYRNLIVSDDLEMGGVLAAAPIGQAAIQAISAGSDLCLVCHQEDRVREVHEELTRAAERDRKFRKYAERAAERVMAFKRKWARMLRPAQTAPSGKKIQALERTLWEFSEQVRLEALSRAADMRNRSASA
jgi:beta-N-acetylhexosaminidase